MTESESLKLKIAVSRLNKLAILQSSALMKLSAAILGMDGIDSKARNEVLEVFHGLQEHIDVLSELNDLSGLNGPGDADGQ
jgi:hypothetical protein